jgi:hypothetical protein
LDFRLIIKKIDIFENLIAPQFRIRIPNAGSVRRAKVIVAYESEIPLRNVEF